MIDTDRAQARMAQLRELIERYNHEYYILNQPSVSDQEWDTLFQELKALEEQYPEFVTPDSPTMTVGAPASEAFAPVEHDIPMLSLSNVFSRAELENWMRRVYDILGRNDLDFSIEAKIDGVAGSFLYQDRRFVRGATRGDGRVGEDVTTNMQKIIDLPDQFPESTLPSSLEVRGEVYMRRSEFLEMNRERSERGESTFANPRNTTSGALRQIHMTSEVTKPLRVFIYGIGQTEGSLPDAHSQTLNQLSDAGFPISPYFQVCQSADEIWEAYENWMARRDGLDFDIDGMVIKVDDTRLYDELGTVAREPRWATAFKFPASQGITQIIDIQINVGRTGTLNPLAVLEPVQLGGVTISRATLHNQDEMNRLGVKIGDRVIIERAGDVIPKILSVVEDERDGTETEFQWPDHCPVCGSLVERLESEAHSYCVNSSCPAQLREQLKHFVSRGAMDIEGLGQKLVSRLYDEGLVSSFVDIYRLDWETIVEMDGIGAKSVENLQYSIEGSKDRSLARLLFAVGIRHVGSQTAELLMSHFRTIDNLAAASIDEVSEVDGVGPVIAQSIVDWFQEERNRALIDELFNLGVGTIPASSEPLTEAAPEWNDKTVVLTGRLDQLTRSEAADLLKRAGAKVTSSVSSKTSLVVVGEDAGSKADRARELGIEMISEGEFLERIGWNGR